MAEKSSKKLAAAPVAKAASSSGAAKTAPAPIAKPVAPPAQAAAPRAAAPVAAPSSGGKAKVDAKERHRLVAEAAYYRAQKRGFAPGHDVQDWVAAEKEVDARLAGK